jgi:hypothetical protein
MGTLKDMELCSLSFNLADEKQRFSSGTTCIEKRCFSIHALSYCLTALNHVRKVRRVLQTLFVQHVPKKDT